VKKFSEMHQLGAMALLPESLRPIASIFGTMVQETYETHPLLRAACELHMDSRKGRWDVIRVLLEHGANPNIRWMDPVRVEYAKSMSDRHIPYSGEILVDYVVSRAASTPNALELLKLLVEVWSLAIFVPCPPGRNTPSPTLDFAGGQGRRERGAPRRQERPTDGVQRLLLGGGAVAAVGGGGRRRRELRHRVCARTGPSGSLLVSQSH
jgi:hypothetical protein